MSEQFAEEIPSDSGEENENNADDKILETRNRNIKHLELDFCNIFHQAIGKMLNLDDGNNIMYLRRFFKCWYPETTSWCRFVSSAKKDQDFRQLLTCSLYYRLAYMYRIGVVLASATAFHFKHILVENPHLCKMILKKRNLKICSLGSGCPLDVVGIVKVFETVAKIMNVESEIFATVIHADGGWKNASMTALTALEQFRGATWKIKFIQADVSAKKVSPEIVKAIHESDIVTVVNTNTKQKIAAILKNITDVIRPDSLMFILDSSRLPFIKSCGGQTGAIDNFQLIYEELCHPYTLQERTVKRLFRLYHRNFPTFGCDRKLDVFVRVWIKPADDNSSERLHLENPFSTNRENQNSLCTNNYFHNWEVRFAKEMARYGWRRRGINRLISVHQENRSRLLKKHKTLLNRKKEKDLELDLEFSQSEDEEEEWKENYDAKKNLARVQLGVSKISIFNLKCSLKRSTGELAKKNKLARRKPVLCANTCRKMESNLIHNSSVL